MFRPPQLADFVLPPTLSEVNKGKTLVAKRMPKQSEIDRLMKHINKKILRDTRYPESLKDLEAAYTSSAAFRDIYNYLRYNRLPTTKQAAKRIEHLSQDYYVLGKLLFRRIMHKSSPDPIPVLCIPPSRFDNILDYYHDTMVGGHQGMTKTLKTLSEKFFTPGWQNISELILLDVMFVNCTKTVRDFPDLSITENLISLFQHLHISVWILST